jgi:hypothetical protein
MHFKFWQQRCNDLKTLAGFKPVISSSGGGRDDHYATPPGHMMNYYLRQIYSDKN